jgi:hypothetical protein
MHIVPRLLVLVGLLIAAGCQMKPPEGVLTIDPMGPYVAGAPMPPSPIPSEARLAILEPGIDRFRIVAGKGEGETRAQTLTRVEDASAPWRLDNGAGQVQHLKRTGDGSLVMTAIEDQQHNVITRFETPLPVMPAVPPPGEPISVTTPIEVYRRDQLDEPMATGESTLTLTYEADQRLRWAGRDLFARRFRVDYEGSFGVATVQSMSVLFYVDKLGLLAEHYREQGNAFLVPWSKQYTMVRIPPE